MRRLFVLWLLLLSCLGGAQVYAPGSAAGLSSAVTNGWMGATFESYGDSISELNLGDNIAAGIASKTTTMPQWGPNLIATTCAVSGMRFVRCGGVGGQTTAQILARLGSDALASAGGGSNYYVPSATGVFYLGGTNDFSIGGITDWRITFANSVSAIEQLRANGKVPIFCTLLPRSDSQGAGLWPFNAAYNNAVRGYCLTTGTLLCDYDSVFDDGTGRWIGGLGGTLTADGVHPTPFADYLAAIRVGIPLFGSLGYAPVYAATSPLDPLQCVGITNPTMLVGGALVSTSTAGQPSGWGTSNSGSSVITGTFTTQPPTGSVPMNWDQCVVAATSGNVLSTSDYLAFATQAVTANSFVPVPGHHCVLSVWATTSGVATGNVSWSIDLVTTQIFNGQTIGTYVCAPANGMTIDFPLSQFPDGVKFSCPFVVPVNCGQLSLQTIAQPVAISTAMSATIAVRGFTILDLDAQGGIR